MSDAQAERPADWRAIYKLLDSGAYEQAAGLLHEMQAASVATTAGRSDVVAIAAVREICLACLQCQAEVEWHRQAGQATERREQQLKNHAQTMLDWVSAQALADSTARGPMTEPHPAEAPEGVRQSRLSLNARNLMQRVKHLLEAEHTTTATPLTQEKEGPALSDSEPGEPLHLRVEKDEGRAEPTSQVITVEPETPAASAPRGELAEITPLSTEVEEEQPKPALPTGIGAPETPIVSAPRAELAAITPLNAEVEEEEPEPPLPAVIGEPETPIVFARHDELAPITPLSTEVAEEELEPALPAVAVSEESETPIVFAPHDEVAPITPLSTEEAAEELEPPLPAGIGEAESPIVSAPPSELGTITPLSAEAAEEEMEPSLPAVIGEPETPIVPAPPSELAATTPLSTTEAEEQQEPALPMVIREPETPIVPAPPAELAAITPLSTAAAEEKLEPALPAVIGEPETPIVPAPPSELAAITSLSAEVEEEELEPPLPAGIGEPETPLVSVLPATAQRAPESYNMEIYCFGPFRVYQHHQLIEEWNGLRGQAVLKYLVAHRGTPTAKDVLMDVFWPDADPEAARRNLHQAIYSLRQTLRRRDPNIQHIQFENNQYLLNPALSVWIDVEAFQTHIQSGRRLEAAGQPAAAMVDYGAAEGLYQGDFLEEDLYDEWPRPQRERLRTILSGYCRSIE